MPDTQTDPAAARAERDQLVASVSSRLEAARTAPLTSEQEATLQTDIATVARLTAALAEPAEQPVFPVALDRHPGVASEPQNLTAGLSSPLQAGDWIDVDTGKRASLRKGESVGAHPTMKAAAGDPAEAQYGSLGRMLASLATSGEGSAVVPTTWANQIVDEAIPASAIGQAGSTVIPMLRKTVEIGRITGQPTAGFRTEGSAITASDPTFDNVTLTAKTMNAFVVASVEWLADAENATDLLRRVISRAIAQQLDKVALYGGTTAGHGGIDLASPPNPVGILQAVDIERPANILGNGANGTVQTATAFWDEIIDTVGVVEDGNETPNAIVWNSRGSRRYAKATDSMGRYLEAPKTLPPRFISNTIPSYTQGTMTNTATDVFAGDFSQLLIGVRQGMTIQTLTELYAANGQIGILASWRGDIAVARPSAFSAFVAIEGA